MPDTVVTEVVAFVEKEWDALEGSKVALMIDNVGNAVITELEAVGPTAVEQIVETLAGAILAVFTGGGSIDVAIAAGIAAAPAALEAAGKALTTAAVHTLSTAVSTQVQAQQITAGATTTGTVVGTTLSGSAS